MKKINTTPISGAQELLPEAQANFDYLKNQISSTYHKHGYLHIETPVIERTEILLAKAGGDTEKQIYKLIKTSESKENASQALRFDHTVPLARYVIEHENNLTFPFKATQIARNFRGERAQKGRFREFYQCDIDVIGRGSLSIAYDADVISTLLSAFKTFNLKTPVLARISNRKILSGLLEAIQLKEKSSDIYDIIDHSEKVTPEQTKASLEELKLDKTQTKIILDFISINGNRSETIPTLSNLEIDNKLFSEGVKELDQVMYNLEIMGFKDEITADLKIVRGLDYYTGTVFEFILPKYKNIGSVCGGGRYDNLTGYFSDSSSKIFPGVGGSIGLTRLFYILNEQQLLDKESAKPLDYAIIPISEAENEYSFFVAEKLRQKNLSTTIILTDKKLGDKLTNAAKLAKNGIVIGENEVDQTILNVKNFETGETSEINLSSSADPKDFWDN